MKQHKPRNLLIVALFGLMGNLFYAAPAVADPAWCSFTRTAWTSAVASGDAVRIARTRARVEAARHTCPDLYAEATARKVGGNVVPTRVTVKPAPKQPGAVPRQTRAPEPEIPGLKLVTRLPRGASQIAFADSGRRLALVNYYNTETNDSAYQLTSLDTGKVIRSIPQNYYRKVGTSTVEVEDRIESIGAYSNATGQFVATRKDAMVGLCALESLACQWQKQPTARREIRILNTLSTGNLATVRFWNTTGNEGLSSWLDGRMTHEVLASGWPGEQIAAADGRSYLRLRSSPRLEAVVVDAATGTERKSFAIDGYQPISRNTSNANHLKLMDEYRGRYAVLGRDSVYVVDANGSGAIGSARLADSGTKVTGFNFALRLIDAGSRLAVWSTAREANSTRSDLMIYRISPNGTLVLEGLHPITFMPHQSSQYGFGIVDLVYFGQDRFLISRYNTPLLYYDARERRSAEIKLQAPDGSTLGFETASYFDDDRLLVIRMDRFGPMVLFDTTGGLRHLGQINSIHFQAIPGAPGYYLFGSLNEGRYEWQSEIRQYTPASP